FRTALELRYLALSRLQVHMRRFAVRHFSNPDQPYRQGLASPTLLFSLPNYRRKDERQVELTALLYQKISYIGAGARPPSPSRICALRWISTASGHSWRSYRQAASCALRSVFT